MLFKIVSWAYARMVGARHDKKYPPTPTCIRCRGSAALCKRFGCPADPNWRGDGVKP